MFRLYFDDHSQFFLAIFKIFSMTFLLQKIRPNKSKPRRAPALVWLALPPASRALENPAAAFGVPSAADVHAVPAAVLVLVLDAYVRPVPEARPFSRPWPRRC